MKTYINYLKISIIALAIVLVSCDKDSNEDINEDQLLSDNTELIDNTYAKDLENFDHISYKDITYDMAEVLKDDKLFPMYRDAKYLGVDQADPRTVLIFDTEQESDLRMSNLEIEGKNSSRFPDRDYWAARVRIYKDVAFSGSILTYNLRAHHTKRFTKNFPAWMNDQASSIAVDQTTFSYVNDPNGAPVKLYRDLYIKCYKNYSAGGDNITDKIGEYENNEYYPDLHSDGWGDKISSIRVGDVFFPS